MFVYSMLKVSLNFVEARLFVRVVVWAIDRSIDRAPKDANLVQYWYGMVVVTSNNKVQRLVLWNLGAQGVQAVC